MYSFVRNVPVQGSCTGRIACIRSYKDVGMYDDVER